jgi:glycosyltransferase involved in cell wall biosynthesis
MKPVIALVTAYNEESTIGRVLNTLKQCPSIDRIQVVDDASTDNTKGEALKTGVKVYTTKKKIPVGEALQYHLKFIPENECTLFFCDADLINLSVKHVEDIVTNLQDYDMSIGFKDCMFYTYIPYSKILPKSLINLWIKAYTLLDLHTSGERAIKRSAFEAAIRSKHSSGYGLAILLNLYCKNHGGYVACFNKNLTHTSKPKKRGMKALYEIPHEHFQFISTYFQVKIRN